MTLNDLKAGETVKLDGGFTCVKEGLHQVHQDEGGYYFICDEGKHYLEGQEDENGNLVGVETAR